MARKALSFKSPPKPNANTLLSGYGLSCAFFGSHLPLQLILSRSLFHYFSLTCLFLSGIQATLTNLVLVSIQHSVMHTVSAEEILSKWINAWVHSGGENTCLESVLTLVCLWKCCHRRGREKGRHWRDTKAKPFFPILSGFSLLAFEPLLAVGTKTKSTAQAKLYFLFIATRLITVMVREENEVLCKIPHCRLCCRCKELNKV